MPRTRRALAHVLPVVLLAACSGGSGNSGENLPTGMSLETFLPMHEGDRYECSSGVVLRIEAATETNLGAPHAKRIVIEQGPATSGLYWAEDPGRGTLWYGAFDEASGRQLVLQTPVPMITIHGRVPTTSVHDAGEHEPIDAPQPARNGTVDLTFVSPGQGLIHANFLNYPTIYGPMTSQDLAVSRWTFDVQGVDGTYPTTLELATIRDRGPVQITVDGQIHTVVRAVVDGVEYR